MKCLSAISFLFKSILWSIYGVLTILMLKILLAHLLRAIVANLKIYAIYALYPESFCNKNLAIRKVFAFCDSVVNINVLILDNFLWKCKTWPAPKLFNVDQVLQAGVLPEPWAPREARRRRRLFTVLFVFVNIVLISILAIS